MTESKEYKEGFEHYQSSDMARIWENPYHYDSLEATLWENGYKAAQDKFWEYQND